MSRTLLSLVALVALFAVQPQPAVAGQASPRKSSARAAAKPAIVGTININTASATDLEGLPGIGAKTAQRIVEYRQKNGPFKKIEEILETIRSGPYSLSVFDLESLPSVSGSRQKSQ